MFKLFVFLMLAFSADQPVKIVKQKIVTKYNNSDQIDSYVKSDYNTSGKIIKSSSFSKDHVLKSYFLVEYLEENGEEVTKDYTATGELEQTTIIRNNSHGDKIYSKRIYHLRTPVGEYIDQFKYYYNHRDQIIRLDRFSGLTMDTIDWVYNYVFDDKGLLTFTDSKYKEEKRDETEYFYKRGILKKSVSYDYMDDEGRRLPNSFGKYYYNKKGELIRKKVQSCYKWKAPRGFREYIYKYSYNDLGEKITDEFIPENGRFRLEKTTYIYY